MVKTLVNNCGNSIYNDNTTPECEFTTSLSCEPVVYTKELL